MKITNRFKIATLWFGDIVALYASLSLALLLRYRENFGTELIENHLVPFSFLFPLWLIVFYIAGLYDLSKLRNNLDFVKTLTLSIVTNTLLTITILYLIPAFTITPKTNLLLFALIFSAIEIWWRHAFNVKASFREGLIKVLFLDKSPRAEDMCRTLQENPQYGYDVKIWSEKTIDQEKHTNLSSLIQRYEVNLIVVPAHAKSDAQTSKTLYELLSSGLEIRDFPSFYEAVFRRVPLDDINESWFVEHAIGQRKFYDDLKRGLEFVAALVLFILLLPIELLIALAIRLSSPGPIILTQTRTGQGGNSFDFYKFRSMRALSSDGSAETNGAVWSSTNDNRITPIGKFLRHTHLDELPQLINIMKGNLSFVGPRPERPEIVEKLATQVPYYEIRHIVKPGVTGWAQIHHRKDESLDDVREKMKHDLYYIKNRSLIIDTAIILKTVKTLFINPT